MTQKEKIYYLKSAMQLQGINVHDSVTDQVIQTYERICELKGDFSLNDAAEIEYIIKEKYQQDAQSNH
jgi:hypothetical protein